MISRQDERKARRFPRLKSGDDLVPRHLNIIYAFLEEIARLMPGGYFHQHAQVMVTTSAVTAASGATLGKGTAAVQRLYPDGDDIKRGDTGMEVMVFNIAEETIASGRLIQVKRIDGVLVVDFELCDS